MTELFSEVRREDALSDLAAEQFYAFGYAQYERGDWSKAEEAFHVLCARRPLEARNWFGLGATLQEAKEYERAMKAWAMCALLDRESPYAHFHAAECALSLGNTKDGGLALKEAEKRTESPHPLRERIAVLQRSWNL
jgi:type III secretion system low calcium response chaperone LcrH/SycD